MVFTGKTAIVSNSSYYGNSLYNGKSTVVYRKRTCDSNLTSNNPANQYQKLKLIQNTVRVPSSIYTMNLGALNVYQKPTSDLQPIYNDGSIYVTGGGANWNQMSDRKSPHTQVAVTASGSTYHGSSTKRTIVRCRPGALSPGGTGCDIKHNSYDRYLNRIKGKAPLRRGIIPPGFGSPIPFNRAYPIYGGKVTKTNIVNGCNCKETNEDILYIDNDYKIDSVEYNLNIGDQVCLFYKGKKVKGVIFSINNDNAINNKYQILILNGKWTGTIVNVNEDDIIIYSKNNCNDKCNNNNTLELVTGKDNQNLFGNNYQIDSIILNQDLSNELRSQPGIIFN